MYSTTNVLFKGGIKAVVWTDAVQTVIIVIGMVVLVIEGSDKVGGFSVVKERIDYGGRFKFLEWVDETAGFSCCLWFSLSTHTFYQRWKLFPRLCQRYWYTSVVRRRTGGMFFFVLMSKKKCPISFWEIRWVIRWITRLTWLTICRLDPDPRTRHSLWTQVIGACAIFLAVFAGSQLTIQRYLAMRNVRHGQLWVVIPTVFV